MFCGGRKHGTNVVVGNSASQEFVCIRHGKRVVIIAIEIEKTRIHFLSEVSVAIAAVVLEED